jgi:hypothetical protein
MNLEVRSDITCSFCLKPVTDFRYAHVFWCRRSRGHPMISVSHAECDTPDVWEYYSSWTNLSRVTERQEEIRIYFNAMIQEDEFTRQEVKDGLEQIFQSVPDEYFRFTQEDYVAFNEENITRSSETTSSSDIGRCPKCGVIGYNNGPPDPDPGEGLLRAPFGCMNCGYEWTERVRNDHS